MSQEWSPTNGTDGEFHLRLLNFRFHLRSNGIFDGYLCLELRFVNYYLAKEWCRQLEKVNFNGKIGCKRIYVFVQERSLAPPRSRIRQWLPMDRVYSNWLYIAHSDAWYSSLRHIARRSHKIRCHSWPFQRDWIMKFGRCEVALNRAATATLSTRSCCSEFPFSSVCLTTITSLC